VLRRGPLQRYGNDAETAWSAVFVHVDTVLLLHRVYYTLVVIEHGTRRAARASLALLEVETSIYSSDVYTLPMGRHTVLVTYKLADYAQE
jgi:hypothetical protein